MPVTFEEVNVDEVKPFLGRERARGDFQAIIDSIKNYGLKEPITIRRIAPKKKKKKELKRSRRKYYRFEVVKGHGRLEAVKEIGLGRMRCFVVDNMAEIELIKQFLMENEVRQPMSAYERAKLMQKDFDGGMTVTEVARKYGFGESTVLDYLGTLESVSKKAHKLLASGTVSLGDAKYVASLDKREQNAILSQGLHGKDLQGLTRNMKELKAQKKKKINQKLMIDRLLDLKKQLGTKQRELRRVNRLYLMSVGNLKKLKQDPKMCAFLIKRGIDLDIF